MFQTSKDGLDLCLAMPNRTKLTLFARLFHFGAAARSAANAPLTSRLYGGQPCGTGGGCLLYPKALPYLVGWDLFS